MLYLIFDNMRKHPNQDKYRKVNTSSGRFKERFGNKSSGSDIFKVMGFEKKDANFVYSFEKEGDSSSEEEIEVKLPKQKKSGAEGNDEVYRRANQRMFELH